MLGLSTPHFSSETHFINLMLANEPGVLARVLAALQHLNANVEGAQIRRLDASRSSAILNVSLPELFLERAERSLIRMVGVISVDVVPSQVQ